MYLVYDTLLFSLSCVSPKQRVSINSFVRKEDKILWPFVQLVVEAWDICQSNADIYRPIPILLLYCAHWDRSPKIYPII